FAVIPFLDVYNRSFCQRRELLVDIFQEYPDDIEYIYKPSCVPLMRCAGCCNDESLECVPTETYNVTMLIMKIKPFHFEKPVQVSFTEHSRCECRIKKDVQEKKEKKSRKGKGKGLKRKKKKNRDKKPDSGLHVLFLSLLKRYSLDLFFFPFLPFCSHCEPCSERRKRLFVQDPHTCKCSCKFSQLHCKSRQLELNERTCRFVKN
ncbi:VEGFA factor, partial [Amia calva]|nr:VEGFA factor [Amia calva]